MAGPVSPRFAKLQQATRGAALSLLPASPVPQSISSKVKLPERRLRDLAKGSARARSNTPFRLQSITTTNKRSWRRSLVRRDKWIALHLIAALHSSTIWTRRLTRTHRQVMSNSVNRHQRPRRLLSNIPIRCLCLLDSRNRLTLIEQAFRRSSSSWPSQHHQIRSREDRRTKETTYCQRSKHTRVMTRSSRAHHSVT